MFDKNLPEPIKTETRKKHDWMQRRSTGSKYTTADLELVSEKVPSPKEVSDAKVVLQTLFSKASAGR